MTQAGGRGDELRTRHGEYEAALALGFLPRDAALLISPPTPIQAGATQLVVLIALLTVESAAVLLTVELIAAGKLGRPGSGRD